MPLKNLKEIINSKDEKKQKIEMDGNWTWGVIIALFVIILLLILIFSWGNTPFMSAEKDNGLKSYIDGLNGIISKDKAEKLNAASPEEAYAKFKEALKNNDTEAAVYQFSEDIKEDWRATLLSMEKYDLTGKMVEELTELHKEQMDDTTAKYSCISQSDGKEVKHFMDFIKDEKGNWKIKSL